MTLFGVAEIRGAHVAIGADRLGVAAGDHASVDEHRDAIGELEHRVHVVLDEQDAVAALERASSATTLRFRGSCRPSARRAATAWAVARASSPSRAGAARRARAPRPACPRDPRAPPARAQRARARPAPARHGRPPERKLWPACACTASITLSSTVNSGNTDVIWYERPRPVSARRYTGSRVMSRPSKTMLPASGASSPESWLMSVVLPAPLGPMTACISPARDGSDDGRSRSGRRSA